LDWEENDVGIKFSAIDFKHPKKYDFQYTIKDTAWHDIGSRRSLELIDLPNGLHKIQVRARKPGSGWGQPMLLLTVDIVPPIWQRAWFRILVALSLVILIFAAYKFRTARLKQANTILNKLVSERTNEIQSQNEEIASQNDQLHELNQELQAFSYSVSHDLRAPLRSIIAYSKILEEDSMEKLDDSEKRALNSVQRSATRMNNLVNALLEFSKLGRKEIRKIKVDTQQLLKGILEEMSVSTEHKTEFKVGPLPSVWADNNLITQVWINLISNAVKYSAKKDTPFVEIGSYPKGDTIVYYVKDNGAGFDMKYADKLFGVFQRLHNIDEFDGTGVGLALVHRIVAKHGGCVWAEAKVDEGATFYFSLPTMGQ
jgi:light-regulated signal transduction histidine kinase (bacteriophytochrome)